VKNNDIVYAARASNSKSDCGAWSLLLLAATVRSFAHMLIGFRIATKWCCDQDVEVVTSSAFTQRTCDRCGSLQKGRGVVATSPALIV